MTQAWWKRLVVTKTGIGQNTCLSTKNSTKLSCSLGIHKDPLLLVRGKRNTYRKQTILLGCGSSHEYKAEFCYLWKETRKVSSKTYHRCEKEKRNRNDKKDLLQSPRA
jgi:hypothetical protein